MRGASSGVPLVVCGKINAMEDAMAEQHRKTDKAEKSRSLFSLEAGEELDRALAEGFPIYQNGVEIDRFYPLRQPCVDPKNLSPKARRLLALFGSIQGLDWEESEAELERIDRESTSTPPIKFDW